MIPAYYDPEQLRDILSQTAVEDGYSVVVREDESMYRIYKDKNSKQFLVDISTPNDVLRIKKLVGPNHEKIMDICHNFGICIVDDLKNEFIIP